MPSALNTSRTIAVVASTLGLSSACGIGLLNPSTHPPPPPPAVAALWMAPAEVVFAPVPVGIPSSPAHTVTLTNEEPVPLTLGQIWIGSSGGFEIQSTTCTAELQPQETCTILLTFSPRSSGPRTGRLYIQVFGYANASVKLSGVGLPETAPPPPPR